MKDFKFETFQELRYVAKIVLRVLAGADVLYTISFTSTLYIMSKLGVVIGVAFTP